MYKMQVKLRHGSLHKNIHKIYVKFENSEGNIKREILVKKIEVETCVLYTYFQEISANHKLPTVIR